MDLAQLLARLRATSASFSPRQLAVLGLAFLAVVGAVIGGAYWSTPNYRLLFADMDPSAASEVVDRLKAQKITYRIDDGGRAIRVPEDRVDELRLAMSAQGLPSSGRIGFEIFDRTAFGATEFLEHVNYRRALEGEIARTIATIGEVSGARVHIAMAKESLFATREEAAKASVILKLKGRGTLPAGTIAGVASLVASSVEGLRPESVVILDNFGRPLTRPAESDDVSGFGVERQQRVEHELSTRVVSLLEPIVGPGRVRVNVAARLNAEAREETEERYDPMTVVRSHQTSNDSQTMGSAAVGGPAGTRANVAPASPPQNPTPPPSPTPQSGKPGDPTPSAPPILPGSVRTAETTNYEVSKLVRHSTVPRGELARLWVAVLVDDDVQSAPGPDGNPVRSQKPRPAAELQKIQSLVAAAVGLDQERGDQLTVENVAFDTPSTEIGTTPTATPAVQAPRMVWVIAIGVGVVVALVLIVIVGRATTRSRRRRAAPPTQLPTVLPRTVQDLQNDIEAQLDAAAQSASAGSQKLPALTRRVGTLAAKEPEAIALLVRSWMTEDSR